MAMRLTDEQLEWLAARVPDAPGSPKGGRPAMDKRRALRGIFWILDNGAKWKDLPRLVHRTVKTVAMVMLLIGVSAAFGYMMALMQIPAKATAMFLEITNNKYVMLMLVNILLLLLGTFMDMAPMLLICTPILLPVMKTFGVDPVHFGMIMIVNLAIGLITPPVGPTLFVGCAIGKVSMEEVSRELWPFYAAMCTALLIITYVPWLSLWIPSMYKL
jgi:tripartite ATP-independent transporter DctM subunit